MDTDAPADEAVREASQPAPHTLPIVYFDEIEASIDCDDFVEGLLLRAAMSVVYGQSNSGKTFLCLDLAMCIAAGIMWCGRQVDQMGVLWLALEGSHGIFNRIAAWKDQHHFEGAVHIAVIPVALNLLDPDADTTPLIATIKVAAERMGIPVGLVVVDTLSRAIAGGNENSPEDMGRLVTNGTSIQQAVAAHVMWIHHAGKDDAKGARGHSLLRAATDTEIEVFDNGGVRVATVKKQRELPNEGSFEFTLKPVELGIDRRGKPKTSCVVVHSDQPAGAGSARRTPLSGHPKRALEVLTYVLSASGKCHPGTPEGVHSIPENWWRERFYESAMPGSEQGTKQAAFKRASDKLINDGFVGMGSGRVWVIQKKENAA